MFEADVIEEFIKIRDRIIEQAYGHLNENQRKNNYHNDFYAFLNSACFSSSHTF